MPDTTGKLGYGTLLKVGSGLSPETFTNVFQVESISGFGVNRALVEVTHMESPNGYREFIAGLRDGKQFSVTCTYDAGNATHVSLIADCDEGTQRHFKLSFPQFTPDKTFNFTGLVLDWEIPPVPDDALKITFQIKISGSLVQSVA